MNSDWITAEHQRRNAKSRDGWECYTLHRDRVTRLLVDAAGEGGGRLGVLGAGNCNDLNLTMLLDSFAQIDLYDLDAEAMRTGISRHQLDADDRLRLHLRDATGVLEELAALSPRTPAGDAALQQCLEKARHCTPLTPDEPFDVVASVCLMTQLIDSVQLAIGEQHPRFAELALAIRNRHLRLLVELTSPGGLSLLITDIVSSTSAPELHCTTTAQLPATVARLINQRNFFTGANPFAIRSMYETDPRLSRLAKVREITDPWLWDFGPRIYAVCAVILERREEAT